MIRGLVGVGVSCKGLRNNIIGGGRRKISQEVRAPPARRIGVARIARSAREACIVGGLSYEREGGEKEREGFTPHWLSLIRVVATNARNQGFLERGGGKERELRDYRSIIL